MSKSQPLRPVRYFIDAAGKRCARVPLANSSADAIVYADDLARLIAMGAPLNWQFNCSGKATARPSYVKLTLPGGDARCVARLIACAGFKEQVHYLNGDRLDLRSDNLQVRAGGKAHKDCSAIGSEESEA